MDFFSSATSYHTISRHFSTIFESTFSLGQRLTKQLIDTNLDCLGILLCVRLNQLFAFELQRRKIPVLESYINATNMLLWPRFQIIIDAHCESLRRLTGGLPAAAGRATTALSLIGGDSSKNQSSAPHPMTQRFAQLLHGVLMLSKEAGDDEPLQNSLGRLRSDYEAFVARFGKSIADARKRQRWLGNNYALVLTIISVSFPFCGLRVLSLLISRGALVWV